MKKFSLILLSSLFLQSCHSKETMYVDKEGDKVFVGTTGVMFLHTPSHFDDLAKEQCLKEDKMLKKHGFVHEGRTGYSYSCVEFNKENIIQNIFLQGNRE